MKKYIFVFLIFLISAIFLFSSNGASATVGGPSFIYKIVYDASSSTVYYLSHDHSGRGCPPIINKLDLKTGEVSILKTCDEIFSKGYTLEIEEENEKFIHDTLGDFPYLQSVSLRKNNFSFDVKVIEEIYQTEYGWGWTNFKMAVSQDNAKKAEFDFVGCSPDQPNIVEGYRIPDTDNMILLISGKGACFEGGYITESLHLIRGIKYYDTTLAGGTKYSDAATELNPGNLVVYASSDIDSTPPSNCPESNKNIGCTESFWQNKTNLMFIISALLLGLIIGLVIGFLIKKRPPLPSQL